MNAHDQTAFVKAELFRDIVQRAKAARDYVEAVMEFGLLHDFEELTSAARDGAFAFNMLMSSQRALAHVTAKEHEQSEGGQ